MPKTSKNAKNSHGDPMEMLATLLTVFRDLPNIFDEAHEIVGQTDHESQDLLHEVELLSLSKAEASEVLAALRDNRAIRREAKDFMVLAKPLYDFVKKHKHLATELAFVQTEMNKQARIMRDRVYTPRVRHEKSELFLQRAAKAMGTSPDVIRDRARKAGEGYDEAASTRE